MALLEARPFRPFKSSEEYLEAMKEDLAEWLNILYPELNITADNFMDRLDTGVVLCKHANNVRQAAEEYLTRRQARNKSMTRSITSGLAGPIITMGNIHYLPGAKNGTFFARDNVSNFITWCRKSLKIIDCLLFETDDLIMRKNEKHVILCLLEVARRGAKFGMLAPLLVQMERQIDREIAADNKANDIASDTHIESVTNHTEEDIVDKLACNKIEAFDDDTDSENDEECPTLIYGPKPQIITNDLKSLDEMVRDLVEKCTCPSQFPMIRVSEGKYRIGDTKVLIFVRILRSHVMVRVGGGWDTLSHYLDKHDPCRCKAQHRTPIAARFLPRLNSQIDGIELHRAQVIFDRSPPLSRKSTTNTHLPEDYNNSSLNNHSPLHSTYLNNTKSLNNVQVTSKQKLLHRNSPANNLTEISLTNATDKKSTFSPNLGRRSNSPSPRHLLNKHKRNLCNNGPKSLPIAIEYQDYEKSAKTIQGNSISLANFDFDDISNNGSENSDEDYRSLEKPITHKQKSLQKQRRTNDVQLKNICKQPQRGVPVRINLNDSSYPRHRSVNSK